MITQNGEARYQGMGKDGQGWVSTQSGVLKDQSYGFNDPFRGRARHQSGRADRGRACQLLHHGPVVRAWRRKA